MSQEHRDFTREGILEFSKNFPFFNLIGLEIIDLEPGWSKTSISFRPDLTNPGGIMHGGVIASLIDTGIAHSILMTDMFQEIAREGGSIVSVDLRIKYFRPITHGTLICESLIIKPGKQILHAESIVTDKADREVARGDAIYMAVTKDRLSKS